MQVNFKAETISFPVEFNHTRTAREIMQKLPISSTVSTWGEEIYFGIGFKVSAEGAAMEVAAGDVAYWPQGKCLCVFFGPTPASTTEAPVPASPVVVVGRIKISPAELKVIELGEKISVEAV